MFPEMFAAYSIQSPRLLGSKETGDLIKCKYRPPGGCLRPRGFPDFGQQFPQAV